MNNTKTFFLGEMLMRLECPDHTRFSQAANFKIHYTGAELNSAVAMRHLGSGELYLITAVPDTALGDAALNTANHWGIHTGFSIRKPGRLGTFYLEQGFDSRPSAVIYDRSGSVFAESDYDDYAFEEILTPGTWLYVSGTLPALTPEKAEFTKQVFRMAKSQNCTVCMDLNYRSALWSWERASAVFTELLEYVDILTGSESLTEAMFGVPANQLCRTFSLRCAGLTRRREPDAALNICSGALYFPDGTHYESREFSCHMLDRIGGGDAFSGGLLHGLQNQFDPQKTIDFAVGALVLKQTNPGDFGLSTAAEVEALLSNEHIAVKR